jgi:FkbM family methyltransferase
MRRPSVLWGIARTIAAKRGARGLGRALRQAALRRVSARFNQEYWWQGRIVELLGNRALVDGIAVDLAHPQVSTLLKAFFLKGIYELPERRLLKRYLPPHLPVIELGASIGVVSCVTNRRLVDPERHIVVEPDERLLPVIAGNRGANACSFEVVHAALAYGSDSAAFCPSPLFTSGSLHGEGDTVRVPATTVRALAERAGFDRFNLICDIEGMEVELVRHELSFLREHAQWLLVEMHPFPFGAPAMYDTDIALQNAGFALVEAYRMPHMADQGVFCYRNSAL